jgi:hypothetical protein
MRNDRCVTSSVVSALPQRREAGPRMVKSAGSRASSAHTEVPAASASCASQRKPAPPLKKTSSGAMSAAARLAVQRRAM